MSHRTTEPPRRGAAAQFINRQISVGRVAFPLSQLMTETGLSESAAKSQVHRLGSRVTRLAPKQAFFLIVTPEHSVRGSPPVEWWIDDYFAWLHHPYYLALQSAAGVHGSNPQSIQVTQVMTDTSRRPIAVGRLKIVFFVKRRIDRTPTQQLPSAFAPTRVSTPAATVFDLVRYAGHIGGIGRAMETARPLLANLNARELLEVLAVEDETATAQRLGYLVEMAGFAKLATTIEAWLPRKRPLIPLTSAATGATGAAAPTAARWRIIDNSGEFCR